MAHILCPIVVICHGHPHGGHTRHPDRHNICLWQTFLFCHGKPGTSTVGREVSQAVTMTLEREMLSWYETTQLEIIRRGLEQDAPQLVATFRSARVKPKLWRRTWPYTILAVVG